MKFPFYYLASEIGSRWGKLEQKNLFKSFEEVENPFYKALQNEEKSETQHNTDSEFVFYENNAKEKKTKTAKKQNGKSKKPKVSDLVVAIFVTFAVMMLLLVISQGENANLLGYSFKTVLTDSMESEIPKDSLVVIEVIDPADIKIGDIITFKSLKHKGETITHKVVQIDEDYDGEGTRAFYTWGIENELWDDEVVLPSNVIGIVVNHFEGVGGVIYYFQNPKNLWVPISFIVGVIVLYAVIRALLSEAKKAKKLLDKA